MTLAIDVAAVHSGENAMRYFVFDAVLLAIETLVVDTCGSRRCVVQAAELTIDCMHCKLQPAMVERSNIRTRALQIRAGAG